MNSQKKRCFVIGPMSDMKRLNKLALKVIKPIVTKYGFEVVTPEEGVAGHIMHHVLLELERSDLLIADISGNNPNVMYELGIYHSFGKPYLVIKDSSIASNDEKTPFDIQSYRFHTITLNNCKHAIDFLRPKIESLIDRIDIDDYFENPVTDFYGSPIAEIPTAIGLFKNYKKNFLEQLIPLVFQKNESDNNYQVQIGEADSNEKPCEYRNILTETQRDSLKIRILLPNDLEYATHENIRYLKEQKKIDMQSWNILRKSRPFGIQMAFENGTPYIIDIPSVLATLNESIQKRRNIKNNQIKVADWEDLERKEIERFTRKCEAYHNHLSLFWKERIELVKNWEPGKP